MDKPLEKGSLRVKCSGRPNDGVFEVWTGTEWVKLVGVTSFSFFLAYNQDPRATVVFDGMALEMMTPAERVHVEMLGPPKLPLGD